MINVLDRNFHFLQNVLQNLFGFKSPAFRVVIARTDDNAVRENGQDEAFNIVGDAVIATFD